MISNAAFLDDSHLRVGEVDFHCSFTWDQERKPVPAGFLPVMKSRDQIDRYLRLRDEFQAQVVVELGIRWGGSTVLLHALFQPSRLIAIEIETAPAAALSTFIEDHDLAAVVRPHYGVNQADRDGLAAIMKEELTGAKIDLVIDDASHLLDETRTSFEILFPLMRPGGLYVIEDWNADHLLADCLNAAMADADRPGHAELAQTLARAAALKPIPDARLVRLPLELVLARARTGDVIREITVMDNWVVIRRGEQPIDPASFRLADLAKDHFANLRPLD